MRVKSFIVTNYNYLERKTNEEIIKLEAKGNEIVDIKITPFPNTDDCSLVTILYKQIVEKKKTDYTTDDTYTITLPPVQIPYEPTYTNDFIKITC